MVAQLAQQTQKPSGWALLSQPDTVHEIERKAKEGGLGVSDLKTATQRMKHSGTVYDKPHYGGGHWDFAFSVPLAPGRIMHLVVLMREGRGLQLGVFRQGNIPDRWVTSLIEDFNEALDMF